MNIELTEQQKKAVNLIDNRENKIVIITGKAGTGKTTVIKEVIKQKKAKNLKIFQCAPTGKAAKRMMDATNFQSSTIHSLLECAFDEHGKMIFVHDENNKLHADLIIVDEMSMVNLHLFNSLLKAIDFNLTQLLLIGDIGQLPSIGHGAILRDLLEVKNIPHIDLNIIHRNCGKIVETAALVYEGKVYEPEKRLSLESDNKINLIHLEVCQPDNILENIRGIVCERMPLRGYNPVDDVQVISPTNSKGQLSCYSINKVLQKELNKDNANYNSDNIIICKEDKVIQTKNEKLSEYVVNGDIGKVIEKEIDAKNMIIEFYNPTRKVEIEKSKNHLLLAYCITCHRMQGSEAPVVIIPVHTSFSYFTTVNWFYTAITRAKDICITIGQFIAVKQMIANINNVERYTKLTKRIYDKLKNI